MTCCVMLCRVAGQLITQYGFSGAEKELKLHHDLWTKDAEELEEAGTYHTDRFRKIQKGARAVAMIVNCHDCH